jgi:catechol 2,3-dioxygenase
MDLGLNGGNQMNESQHKSKADFKIDPQTRIGHIHLKVSNLERSVKFYTEVLGFELTSRMGRQAAFLSAGGYHHHIGLNTWESAGGSPPPERSTGLYHFAILLPDRRELARVLQCLLDNNWPLDGAADHGVSEALYLKDPDGNGIELYIDRPQEQWPHDSQGQVSMYTRPLALNSLLAELQSDKVSH